MWWFSFGWFPGFSLNFPGKILAFPSFLPCLFFRRHVSDPATSAGPFSPPQQSRPPNPRATSPGTHRRCHVALRCQQPPVHVSKAAAFTRILSFLLSAFPWRSFSRFSPFFFFFFFFFFFLLFYFLFLERFTVVYCLETVHRENGRTHFISLLS